MNTCTFLLLLWHHHRCSLESFLWPLQHVPPPVLERKLCRPFCEFRTDSHNISTKRGKHYKLLVGFVRSHFCTSSSQVSDDQVSYHPSKRSIGRGPSLSSQNKLNRLLGRQFGAKVLLLFTNSPLGYKMYQEMQGLGASRTFYVHSAALRLERKDHEGSGAACTDRSNIACASL